MMSRVVFIALAVCVALAAGDTEKYSTEHDNFDIDGLIAKPEEFKKFSACFLDNGPCNSIASHFKKDLNEAVQLACAKCTDAQKHIMNRYLAALKDKYPQDYEAFKEKYDSENKYLAALEKALEKA